MKRQRSRALIYAITLGIMLVALAGCSPHYHLVGNHTWSAPAPQPRDTGLNLPATAPASGAYGNKGPTSGNTSFARD